MFADPSQVSWPGPGGIGLESGGRGFAMVQRVRAAALAALLVMWAVPMPVAAAQPKVHNAPAAPTVLPGSTLAPDALSAAFRAGADPSHVAIDITWDQPALADSGGSGSAMLITLDGVSVDCLTPATGSVGASGGTAPGGNGTATWTMTCGSVIGGLYDGAKPSATNIARVLIVGDTASDLTHTYFNGLEQINVSPGGRTSILPDLISVAVRLGTTDAAGNPVDEVVYRFDLTIDTLNSPGALGVVPDTGGGDATIADSSGPFPGDGPVVNGDEVRVYFPAGTLTNVVEAFADAAAVTSLTGQLNEGGSVSAGGAPAEAFGTVAINGGAATTASQTVTLTFPNADASVASVKVSNHADMTASDTFLFSVGLSLRWPLAGHANGSTQTVYVQFSDGVTESVVHSASIVVDTAGPVMGRLAAPRILVGNTVGSTIPVYLSWGAATDASGVATYQVLVSKNGGAYATLTTTASRHATLKAASSASYRFQVIARDALGNVGVAVTSASFKAVGVQQTSATYSGLWGTTTTSSAWGGSFRYSIRRGSTATYRFSGRAIAWVAPRASSYGSARVYLDGRLVATVSLQGAAVSRRIDYVAAWSSSATHTIRIVVLGTAGHPRVVVDGFVVLR